MYFAFVGLGNKLYTVHGAYIKIIIKKKLVYRLHQGVFYKFLYRDKACGLIKHSADDEFVIFI